MHEGTALRRRVSGGPGRFAVWVALVTAGCATVNPTPPVTKHTERGVHRVAEGDTLYSIARRYGVDLGVLAAFNGISRPEHIVVGQELVIPDGHEVVDHQPHPPPPVTPSIKTKKSKIPSACRTARAARRTGAGSGLYFPPVRGRVHEAPTNRTRAEVNIRAPHGSPVWASADGKVVFSGTQIGYGQLVAIRHQHLDVMTVYGRVGLLCVPIGQKVRRGDVIAILGKPGEPGTVDLYYEVRKGKDAVPSARW